MEKILLILLGLLFGFIISASKPDWAVSVNNKIKHILSALGNRIAFWK